MEAMLMSTAVNADEHSPPFDPSAGKIALIASQNRPDSDVSKGETTYLLFTRVNLTVPSFENDMPVGRGFSELLRNQPLRNVGNRLVCLVTSENCHFELEGTHS